MNSIKAALAYSWAHPWVPWTMAMGLWFVLAVRQGWVRVDITKPSLVVLW